MRRRSERKKTPDVSSSPAPTRRSSRRSRRASPSPDKSDNSSMEQEVAKTSRTSRRRTTSTPSKDSSPAKRGRSELNRIDENGDGEAALEDNKLEEVEKSIEPKANEGMSGRKISDDKQTVTEQPPTDEDKNVDNKEKKVRQTDKHLDDKEQSTEIQTPKESKDSEKSLEKDEKSPSKHKRRSKEREKSSSERQHKRDKDLKTRKVIESDTKIEETVDTTISESNCKASIGGTNGDKINESFEKGKNENNAKKEVEVAASEQPTQSLDEDVKKTIKKRKWVSRKSSENKILAISTDSLKSLISDPVHPVPLSDVHLDSSPEIEMVHSEIEGQAEDKYSNRKSPEKSKSSKEELEEGEDESEEEEGQIEKGKPPVKNNSSSILYITNLVRPFTIMQLKGLLARTGKIAENGFWIDRIKSKCYVKFGNEDEAIETRHALHGVRWPTSNPKCLNVEFGTEEALNAVLSSIENVPKAGVESSKENRVVGIGWDGNGFEEERKIVRQVREWDMGKREEFQKERARERIQDERKEPREVDKKNPFKESEREEERRGRERRHRSPSQEMRKRSRSNSPAHKMKKENEPPLRLLDDLFRKTKAAPCVYWLPLTPEQILEKEQRRLKRVQEVEEHRRDREKREKERERQRESEREQRRNRNRSADRDRNRDRSRDDRRRSRSRERRRY